MAVAELSGQPSIEWLRASAMEREPRLMTPEGVILDRPLPNHELSVAYRMKLWEDTLEGIGHFRRDLVTLNDGSQYEEQQAEPLLPRFEVGVTMTTPWFTRIPGFNTEVQKLLAQAGIASDLIGPPELPKGLFSTVHNLLNLDNLVENAHDAAAQLAIARAAADKGLFDGELLAAMGYSRGGMIIWDLLGYAERFGFKIIFFDSNDPCLVVPLRLDDIDPTELETYTYPARETLAFFHAMRNHSLRDIWNLLKTVDGSPHLLQHAAVGFALFQGQAGWHMGSMPRDSVGTVRIYDGSVANQGMTLRASLEPFASIHFLDRTGLHLSGANPNVRRAAVGRTALALELHQAGQPLQDVDWRKISPHRA